MRKTSVFFEKAFRGYKVPEKIRETSEEICNVFNINGICDPMYISNVIARESGSGDGESTFTSDEIKNIRVIAERLQYAYGSIISRNDIPKLEKILLGQREDEVLSN
ncbi:MAG TPA: hypothetical protein DCS12_10125 [Clostridiales bacterium]|nr:hypothetical protein [Clostridiales bacterium]